jgi:hypothetical protein
MFVKRGIVLTEKNNNIREVVEKLFGSKRNKLNGKCRSLLNWQLHYLYRSSSIVKQINQRIYDGYISKALGLVLRRCSVQIPGRDTGYTICSFRVFLSISNQIPGNYPDRPRPLPFDSFPIQ